MLKPKRPRRGQPVQNPISDMEQFYLNQYFRSAPTQYGPGPTMHPFANRNVMQQPAMEMAKLHELEMRIARIEQQLGFGQRF